MLLISPVCQKEKLACLNMKGRSMSLVYQFQIVILFFLMIMYTGQAYTTELQEKGDIEVLELDIISYDDFVQNNPQALSQLRAALYQKGIVGIKGIPGYLEKVRSFINRAREFTHLPEEIKNCYAPNHEMGDTFLGYEAGKERFQRPDGTWVVDDLKVSYYASVPNDSMNKWPSEVDLQTPFQDLAALMSDTGEAVMIKMGLVGGDTEIGFWCLGRMLYYRKNETSTMENTFWCGAHFDHGLFTALLPAFYYSNEMPIAEPIEAGLFVREVSSGSFKKVIANDPDVLLFQVGEFGQLATHDGMRATEHRVHKAKDSVERYTLALFFNAKMDNVVRSFSELTSDERYGGEPGTPCSFSDWHERTFNRFIVKETN